MSTTIKILPGQLDEVGTTQLLPVGTRYIDNEGNEYRYVLFGTGTAGYVQYAACVMTATYGTVSPDYSSGLAGLYFAGVCMGTPVAGSYGWIMTRGLSYYVGGTTVTSVSFMMGVLSGDEDGQLESTGAVTASCSTAGVPLVAGPADGVVSSDKALIVSNCW